MAKIEGFDPDNIPSDDLPAGDYTAIVAKADIKGTKADESVKYVALEIQVCDGQMKGRKIWENLHINNANDTCRNMAQRRLKQIGDAVGVARVVDTDDLLDRPFLLTVRIGKDQDGTPRAEMKSAKPLAAQPPTSKQAMFRRD